MLDVEWTGHEEEANCEDARVVLCLLGTFELFSHARIPTFTATFVKNRVEMLMHSFALFFHCVIEAFVVLVCQLGVVFYKSHSFRVFLMIFVEIQSVMNACFYPIDHMNCLP